MTEYTGTAGDDSFAGGAGDDLFYLDQGGADTVQGGEGGDVFRMGAAFSKSDRVDGGGGIDLLHLAGDYSAGLELGRHSLRNVEAVLIHGEADLTLHEGNTAAGQSLLIQGHNALTLDASAETDGSITAQVFSRGRISLGQGDDVLQMFSSMTPADTFDGGAGTDLFQLYADTGLRFSEASMRGFEGLNLYGGGVSRLFLTDANVAPGLTFTIRAYGGPLFLSGGKERDGSFDVNGGAGGDSLIGGRGGDTLHGAAGDDVLAGGRGGDSLSLGDGDDRVLVRERKDSTALAGDTVFGAGAGDEIDLSGVDADKGSAGDQAFVLVESFSGAAGEAVLAYDEVSNSTTLMLETNGKGAPEMQILLDGGDYTDFGGFVW